MIDEDSVPSIWLDDELYNKGKFLVRGAITRILEPLRLYGQEPLVLGAIEEIWKICEDWGVYVRGDLEKPLSLDYIRRSK